MADGATDSAASFDAGSEVGSATALRAVVIIPHYNDMTRLRRGLVALKENDCRNTEIVVVDNGSTQSLEPLRAEFPDVRFLYEETRGAAAARNRGVAESTAPLLFFLDADCVAAPDWLVIARRVVGRADLIGGRVDVFDETPAPRSGAEAFETVFAFDFRNYIEVQGFTGAGNMITRRDVFDAVGPFRGERAEDVDWSRRAVAMGFKLIYEDTLVVSHPSRSDWPALRAKWHRTTREMCATNGDRPRDRVRWALRALAMPASVLVHLPRVLFSPDLIGLGERGRGAVTLARLRLQRMVWMLRQAIGLTI